MSKAGKSKAISLVKHASMVVSRDINNTSALEAAKAKLVQSRNNDRQLLAVTAILAVLTNDHKTWSETVSRLGSRMEPRMGYDAYGFLKRQGPSSQILEEWFYIVSLSATEGYFLAKSSMLEKRVGRAGVLGRPIVYIYKTYLAIRAFGIALRDKTDPRLPSSSHK